ncbi:MAG: hypothetical protein MPI95_01115 [Nitrosopumilus sp.]|nr:hypothetical protein [Nitrosopumilus sp.]CAI9832134.1 hypothetical protein IBTHAUMO2_590075 [Nitrosopumilaceae archaeon]MDA7945062.1 hypothetical protein [Nitrosopumilus sp.]MDA7952709.1 hypothetical protein [Nitrosopumilus sp.]MDA7954471.1 hypothetical protein [Nitrosopumilus sp.]
MNNRVYGEIEDRMLKGIQKCKKFINDMPIDEMPAFIYSTFPGKSKLCEGYDSIMSMQKSHIMTLVEMDKISMGRAAELLGITINAVMAEYASRQRLGTYTKC